MSYIITKKLLMQTFNISNNIYILERGDRNQFPPISFNLSHVSLVLLTLENII